MRPSTLVQKEWQKYIFFFQTTSYFKWFCSSVRGHLICEGDGLSVLLRRKIDPSDAWKIEESHWRRWWLWWSGNPSVGGRARAARRWWWLMGEDVLTGGNYRWAEELNSEVRRTYNEWRRRTQCLRPKRTVFSLLLSPSLTPHTPLIYSENVLLFIHHQYTWMRLCSQQYSFYVFCTDLKWQPLQLVAACFTRTCILCRNETRLFVNWPLLLV